MLDGDIQVFDDLGLRGDDVDHLLGDLVRVEVVEPYPVDALDFTQAPQQLGQQVVVTLQVQAVAADILGHDDQLLDAVGSQLPGLVEHVVQLPAAVAAPEGRNHAVGAVVVTALGDF